MEIDKRHKTLIDLWKSSFLVHNDLIKVQSLILENVKRDPNKRVVIDNKDVYPALIAAQALLLSIFKEKVIEKDQYDNNLLIDKGKFNRIISDIIKIKNNKAYIGNIEFKDEIEAFVFLRNKLLHGEYYLEDDQIYLEKDNQTTKFKLLDLTNLVLDLQSYMETTLKSKNTSIVEPLPNTKHLSMKTRLERGLFNVVNATIRKKGTRKTTYEDLANFNNYIQSIKNIMLHNNVTFEEAITIFQNDPTFKETYTQYMDYFATNHLEIAFKKIPLNSHPKYEQVKKTIINDNNVFYNMDRKNPGVYDQECFMPLIEDILKDNNSILTTNALRTYISILSHYILNDGKTIYNSYQYFQSNSITFLDDITLISQFVCFYAKFHYGLDELLSDGRNTNLSELLKNEKLDFASLALDEFEDPNMTMDIRLTSVDEQSQRIRKDYQKCYESFLKSKQQYENIIDNPKISRDTLEKIKNNYLQSKDRYQQQKQLLERLDNFDLDKYERYINIVNHVRNAFAHGNVTIKSYEEGDTLRDRKIHIVDIYNGEVTYEKEMTYREFFSIFQVEQNRILKDYVENVATEENYSNLLRDMTYEATDTEGYVEKDKLPEWQAIIEDYRKKEDGVELDCIVLAYCQMKTIDFMGDDFTVENFCQNTINFLNYFTQQEQQDIQESGEYVDPPKFDIQNAYNKIMHYVVTYSNNCPESLKMAYESDTLQRPQNESGTAKH